MARFDIIVAPSQGTGQPPRQRTITLGRVTATLLALGVAVLVVGVIVAGVLLGSLIAGIAVCVALVATVAGLVRGTARSMRG